jgi:hypothetical protein
MAEPTGPIDPVLFAALALERGLLTPAAFTLAAEGCAVDGTTLPEQLIRDGVLTADQRDQLAREVFRVSGAPHDEEAVPFEHAGRYEVTGRTGSGGQAVVMVALDRFIGREVALKILAPQDDGETEASLTTGKRSTPHTVRFLREARVTGQLEHPNIVPVHEVGRRADGTLY